MPGSCSSPVISAVVPAYNRRDLTHRAVESLLAQDLAAPYEIVVVDDGSTDGTARVLSGMDARVRVIRQENRGAAVARHVGVRHARAPIVAFHDADDLAPPCKLATLLAALRDHPECVAAFGVTLNRRWETDPSHRWSDGPLDGRREMVPDPFGWLVGHGGPIAEAMNLAARREACLLASRNRAFYRAANDYDFQIRLARHGSFVHVARVTCIYTEGNQGISGRQGEFRQMAYALCAADEALRHARDGRRLQSAFRQRVEGEWPRAAIGLAVQGEWALLRRILVLAARHGRGRQVPRHLWWTLQSLVETRPGLLHPLIERSVRTVRDWRSEGERGLCPVG